MRIFQHGLRLVIVGIDDQSWKVQQVEVRKIRSRYDQLQVRLLADTHDIVVLPFHRFLHDLSYFLFRVHVGVVDDFLILNDGEPWRCSKLILQKTDFVTAAALGNISSPKLYLHVMY